MPNHKLLVHSAPRSVLRNTAARMGNALLLIAVYCVAIGASVQMRNPALTSSHAENHTPYVTTFVTGLYCHAPQTGGQSVNFNSLPLAGSQQVDKVFGTLAQPTALLCCGSLRNYISKLPNLQISSRQTALLFPFHYFW